MVPAIVGANLTGAIVVFALLAFVLPLPDVEDQDTLLLVNLAAAGAYVAVACVIGTVWGLRAAARRAVARGGPRARRGRAPAPRCGSRCGISTSR